MYGSLRASLPELIRNLRKAGYKAGIDQILAARLLFDQWSQKPRLTGDVICASLCALFSTSPDEQEQFADVFRPWYKRHGSRQDPLFEAAPKLTEPPEIQETARQNKLLKLLVSGILLIVLALMFSPRPIEDNYTGQSQDVSDGTSATTPRRTEIQSTRIRLAPRQPPEPVIAPARYYPRWATGLRNLVWLPLLCWAGWLCLSLGQRYLILRNQKDGLKKPVKLNFLHLKKHVAGLFPATALKKVLRFWRKYRPFHTHRLHVAATVRHTLERGGYFAPAYKDRFLPPEYAVVIDRRHSHDYVAHLAGELLRVMKDEGLFISTYYYDNNPRYCWPAGIKTRCYALPQLADRHPGHNLLVIGEAGAFSPSTNAVVRHGADWAGWSSKVLLTVNSPEQWGAPENRLIEDRFQVYPFTRRSLMQLVERKRFQTVSRIADQAYSADYRDSAMPQALDRAIPSWFDEDRPHAKQRKAAISALKAYLGREGYQLLAAVAAYPALDWQLTLALDVQLGLCAGEEREIRLRKLSRLPWFRHAWLPDVWRRTLIRSLKQESLEEIGTAYRALQQHRDQPVLALPVAIPDSSAQKRVDKQSIPIAPPGDPRRDRVYASVIRGRKPRLLEFTLQDRIDDWLIPDDWRGIAGPALMGLVVASGLVFGIAKGWQNWGKAFAQNDALQAMKEDLKNYRIKVDYVLPELETSARVLAARLADWGFPVGGPKDITESEQQTVAAGEGKFSTPPNRIIYSGATNRPAAQLAEARLRYLTWGAAPIMEKYQDTDVKEISITLVEAYRPGTVFRARVLKNLSQPVLRDRLKNGGTGPAMVKIPAGCFQMGSPDSESGRDKDEGPQRRVCIDKPFFIGRHEVTFDDYRKFVNATKFQEPEDRGWGRDVRPVINVSWEDAIAYAKWLSELTGKTYRLPSEAEWEYAARAGSETAFWWGDKARVGWANCRDCGSLWGGDKTAPVGSFGANNFGLFDTVGNVWEWVQDCWHDNYVDAPSDGSAWESSKGGDCSRRVIRGGSWNYDARYVRSANRVNFPPGWRDINLGFRLAQDSN